MRQRLLRPTLDLAAAALGTTAPRAVKHRRMAGAGLLAAPPAVTDPGFEHLLEALTGEAPTSGNAVTVLRNGCRIFPAMLDAIRSAARTIDFATYVYWEGLIADEFGDALEEGARAGGEVNVLLDAVGAAKMDQALVERLRAAGVVARSLRRVPEELGGGDPHDPGWSAPAAPPPDQGGVRAHVTRSSASSGSTEAEKLFSRVEQDFLAEGALTG